ncbi:LysR family transcriptional regulator [Caproiciproducens sp. NJN-50]|uniref:LysR family transcriptional regulator n=1 Tax=Acutalibacteraceae TaxID=3082771 RepID=UPI000FFE23AB|nr:MULTISPECIES: LysR family transcriptional regulator [Acutalibacteraceae]QAT48894.1 LysR family transcriptional regulator [Caproiciproducens sp. NJN-50]
MDFQYLESFYTTVKYNSISKAAVALHLTQPGLSLQLKSLENEMGTKLLDRSNKGVRLTEEGKVVYNYAVTILSLKGNIKRDLKNLQENHPKLNIGSCYAVGEFALPCSIYIFKKFYDDVDIQVKLMNSTEVIERLLDHTIGLGIIQDHPRMGEVIARTIISDELVLVGHSCGGQKKIDLEKLKRLPLILREKTSSTGYLLEKALQKESVSLDQLHVIYHLDSPGAIKSSVSAGNGFSFLPKLMIKKELKEGTLEQIEIDRLKIVFNYNMAYRKDSVLSGQEKNFIEFIHSNRRGFC